MFERMIRQLNPLGWCAVIAFGAMTVMTSAAYADSTFTYQGQLRHNGEPVTDPVNLSFRLHADEVVDDQVGDTLDSFGFDLFDDDGRFTLDLDFGDNVFDGTPLWLEIWVNGAPLSPRQPIMPTPYAIRALSVSNDGLGGSYANQIDLKNPANNISGNFDGNGSMLTNLNASNINSGTIGSSHLGGTYGNVVTFSHVSNEFTGAFAGHGSQLTSLNASNIAFGNLNPLRMPTGGSWNLSSNLNIGTDIMFFDNANSRVGIGTNSPNSRLHVIGATNENALRVQVGGATKMLVGSTGGVAIGATIASPPTDGLYVQGNIGIQALNPSLRLSIRDNGVGFDRPTLNTLGVYTSNTERMRIDSIGRVGIGTTTPSLQVSIVDSGVGFDRPATNALAMYTDNTERVRINSVGRVGIGTTTPASLLHVTGGGTTIRGVSTSFDGIEGQTSTSGAYGVWGRHLDGGRGVVGSASGDSSFGVFASGNSGATGTKSFQIDHPLDPENKYLLHYSAEGPEPYNMYRGNVVLDAFGEAWVDLPDYFEAINRDFHYQLTSIGAPGPNLHVAVEIHNNMFFISGGSPSSKVSWTVTAVRNDPHVREYPTTDERMKPEELRGTYQHPELYGLPADRSEHSRRALNAGVIGEE